MSTGLENLSLRMKISISFTTVLIMLLAFGTWSFQFSQKVYNSNAQVLEESQPFAQLAGKMERDIIQVQQWLTDISATRALDGLDDGFAEAEDSYQSFLKGLSQFEQMYKVENDDVGLQAVAQLRTLVANYYEVGKNMAQDYIDNGPAGGNKAMADFDEAAQALSTSLQPFLEQQNAELRTELVGVQAMAKKLQVGTFIICLVVALLVVGVGWMLIRSITRPIESVVHMIEEMERGHLDQRLNLKRRDEIGRMSQTMDAFADSLQHEVVATLQKLAIGDLSFEVTPRDDQDRVRGSLQKLGRDLNKIMAQIQTASEQIASGSTLVSDSSQALSQGATEQASSLEEITSSMTEMDSQVKVNAENASQADQYSSRAKASAEDGNVKMQRMLSAMAEVNEAGHSIGRIIKTIDEIAFQTNLLALNAAVEAARAGAHGKGFAVVAEEVRTLAARSAKAARETTELIEGTVKKTENGTEIANETAAALGEIVQGITKVSDLVGEIAAASNEQAQGITQMTQGLGQIDQVTQQNTASAEESASAAEELSGQAGQLRQMLQRFTLSHEYQTLCLEDPTSHREPAKSEQPPQNFSPQKPEIALDDCDFGRY